MVFKLAHVLDDIWNAGLQVEVGYVGVEVDVDLSEKGAMAPCRRWIPCEKQCLTQISRDSLVHSRSVVSMMR